MAVATSGPVGCGPVRSAVEQMPLHRAGSSPGTYLETLPIPCQILVGQSGLLGSSLVRWPH